MKNFFYEIGSGPVIDRKNGTIRGVSLMKTGPAAGHFDKKGRQEMVDGTTIRQLYERCCSAGSIKVKADHGSGVMSTIGWIDNFSMSANKTTGDFHIYDTEPERDRILEIAEKNPDHMGISMEFAGEDESDKEFAYSRCESVFAAALVSHPAANSSLFSAIPPEKKQNETMPENETVTKAEFEELSKKFEALETTANETNTLLKNFAKKFEDEEEKKEASDDEDKKELSEGEDDDKKEMEDEDEKKDDEKSYSAKDAAAIAKDAAKSASEAVLKQFAAKMGITALKSGGPAKDAEVKEKHFEEHVADLSVKEFSGDANKARVAILTNKTKYPDAWKSYEASRQVKA